MRDPRLHAAIIDGGAAPAPLTPRLTASRWLTAAVATVAVCILGTAMLAYFVQGARAPLLREDGIVETASVLCLTAAVLIAAGAIAKRGLRWPLVMGGGLALIELLDELSFGARLFGFAPPALYGGGELDGAHDLLILAYRLLDDVAPGLGLAWLGAMIALSLFALGAGLRHVARAGAGSSVRSSAKSWLADHALFALHVGLVGLAQVFDVAANSRIPGAIEEVLELSAAIVLAFYVVQQAQEP